MNRTIEPPDELPRPPRKWLAAIGRRGGRNGRGAAKARTHKQASAAALARWAKERKANNEP